MTLAKLLPLAFVMIAGPQILSAIFLATTENWRKNTLAFVAGAGLGQASPSPSSFRSGTR